MGQSPWNIASCCFFARKPANAPSRSERMSRYGPVENMHRIYSNRCRENVGQIRESVGFQAKVLVGFQANLEFQAKVRATFQGVASSPGSRRGDGQGEGACRSTALARTSATQSLQAAFERRGSTSKRLKDFCLKAEAKFWP